MSSQPSQDLHNRGWAFAFAIIALAIIVNAGVIWVHNKTYLAPPSTPAAGEAKH